MVVVLGGIEMGGVWIGVDLLVMVAADAIVVIVIAIVIKFNP